MKSNIKKVVTLELTGDEFEELCQIIDWGRSRLQDAVKDLKEAKQFVPSEVAGHERLIQVSVLYTNLRAKL